MTIVSFESKLDKKVSCLYNFFPVAGIKCTCHKKVLTLTANEKLVCKAFKCCSVSRCILFLLRFLKHVSQRKEKGDWKVNEVRVTSPGCSKKVKNRHINTNNAKMSSWPLSVSLKAGGKTCGSEPRWQHCQPPTPPCPQCPAQRCHQAHGVLTVSWLKVTAPISQFNYG